MFTIVSAALFCATLSLFAVIVFMPVFLQVVTGASATGSGLLLLPLLLASTASTLVAGRVMSATGRYKLFPVAGLALMAVGLLLLSQLDAGSSRATASLVLIVFGLGFGMVSQILTVALQNAVERRDLGIATASANLVRSLGGSVGVAVFGAIFAGRLDRQPGQVAGSTRPRSPTRCSRCSSSPRRCAALGLLVVLFLRETPLAGRA